MYSNYKGMTTTFRRMIGRFGASWHRGQGCAVVSLLVVIPGGSIAEPQAPPTSTQVTVNVVRDFGARADGVTDDEPALQRALDYVANQGGGVVYLPGGRYGIAKPLVVRSRVHLTGDGYGKSIVHSLRHGLGKIVDGTGIWSAIALLSATHSKVSRLTVDLASAATHANGIALLPTGGTFEGPPSSNCTISEVEVLGGGNYHAYMIWNLRGRAITISNNLIDGRVLEPVESHQQGIESYGGKDVVISLNTVRNIGDAALNFGSAGLPDTGIEGLVVAENTVSNSGRGLNIGPWLDPTGPQNIANVQIVKNNFARLWKAGVYVQVIAGTRIDGLRIADNSIEGVGGEEVVGATGIRFQGSPPSQGQPAAAASNSVAEGNFLSEIRGVNSIGVLVNNYPGVVVRDNVIDGVGYEGIQAFESIDLIVKENLIRNTGRIAVGSYGWQSNVSVRENTIVGWGRAAAVAAVLITDATNGEVRSNEFQRDRASGSVVIVGPTAANVIVFGNSVTNTDESESRKEEHQNPYVNLGAQSNLGTFVAVAEFKTMEVAHPLVRPTSRIIMKQLSGVALSFSAIPRTGIIDVQFAVAPKGQEVFRYEIDP